MLYSEKLDLAFVHIPKTGGISYRAFLRKNFPDMKDMPELPGPHHTVSELFQTLRKRGRKPSEVTILTLIRHPFAQVASQYRFWRSDSLSAADAALPHVRGARQMSFEEFVRNWIRKDLFAKMLFVRGKLPANVHCVRLENVRQDTERILNAVYGLHVIARIPHLNRSPEYCHSELYTSSIEARVRKTYKWYFQTKWGPDG